MVWVQGQSVSRHPVTLGADHTGPVITDSQLFSESWTTWWSSEEVNPQEMCVCMHVCTYVCMHTCMYWNVKWFKENSSYVGCVGMCWWYQRCSLKSSRYPSVILTLQLITESRQWRKCSLLVCHQLPHFYTLWPPEDVSSSLRQDWYNMIVVCMSSSTYCHLQSRFPVSVKCKSKRIKFCISGKRFVVVV